MSSAEDCKILGNKAVAAKDWEAAFQHYSRGLLLNDADSGKALEVILRSNRSLVLVNLGRYTDALEDASKCIELDTKFEKGYIRYAAALEAMNMKNGRASDTENCPVMKIYKKGLKENPGSSLLQEAMRMSFPWMKGDDSKGPKGSKGSNKKQSAGPTKAERKACVPIDIRGAVGQHELRINGVYVPTEELSGGWPVYRKQTDETPFGDDDDVDEDDNLVLEFHGGLEEWMVKHVSCKGTHRSFVFAKCSPPTRPELCSGTWQGMEDKKLVVQPSMTIMVITDRAKEDSKIFEREKGRCLPVEIRGAVGRKGPNINGIYEPTERSSGGWPLYQKLVTVESDGPEDQGATITTAPVWLEFNAYFKSWQVKPTACLHTNRSWAYANCTSLQGCPPEQCKGPWEVLDEDDFRPQESICVLNLAQWQVDDESLSVIWANSCPLDIRGATGSCAHIINGVFMPLEDFNLGYVKRSDATCVLEYSRSRKFWQIKANQNSYAFVQDNVRTLPENCGTNWYVLVNGNWERQTSVVVMSLESRKALDKELFGDKLLLASPLDVRGATGMNSFKINGVYEPIDEFSGNWPVYQRKGGVDYWLEYHEERGNWQFKGAANRGMDSAFAYADSLPATYPEKCNGPWWVYTGIRGGNSSSGWEIQSTVSVLSVQARFEEDMALFQQRRGQCESVDIRGATGPRGAGLNGVFDPTDEMRGGWPVYRKRDDPEWWLEYDACPQKWMIRPSACRGTTRGRAYIFCEPYLRPEQAKGVWRLSDGKGGWAAESNVQVRTEAEAIVQDRVLFHSRRSTAVDVDIRGACKPVSHINGIYEPTDLCSNGWPVYKKRGGDSHWLEYHSLAWQVKPASFRGTKKCWAYVLCESRYPEYAEKPWYAVINGENVRQDSITIRTLEEQTHDDRLEGALRRKDCGPVQVTGATGVSARSVNGIYEPSPTELCGGWPVFCKRTMTMPRGPLEEGELSGIAKSYLIFSPYAMSWAITVLTSAMVCQSVPSSSSGSRGAGTEVAVEGNYKTGPAGAGDDCTAGSSADSEIPGSSASSGKTQLLNTPPGSVGDNNDALCSEEKSNCNRAGGNAGGRPDISSSNVCTAPNTVSISTETATDEVKSPQTLAFLEVSRIDRPETFAEEALWKVLVDGRFEAQPQVKLAVYNRIEDKKFMELMTGSGNVIAGGEGVEGTKALVNIKKGISAHKNAQSPSSSTVSSQTASVNSNGGSTNGSRKNSKGTNTSNSNVGNVNLSSAKAATAGNTSDMSAESNSSTCSVKPTDKDTEKRKSYAREKIVENGPIKTTPTKQPPNTPREEDNDISNKKPEGASTADAIDASIASKANITPSTWKSRGIALSASASLPIPATLTASDLLKRSTNAAAEKTSDCAKSPGDASNQWMEVKVKRQKSSGMGASNPMIPPPPSGGKTTGPAAPEAKNVSSVSSNLSTPAKLRSRSESMDGSPIFVSATAASTVPPSSDIPMPPYAAALIASSGKDKSKEVVKDIPPAAVILDPSQSAESWPTIDGMRRTRSEEDVVVNTGSGFKSAVLNGTVSPAGLLPLTPATGERKSISGEIDLDEGTSRSSSAMVSMSSLLELKKEGKSKKKQKKTVAVAAVTTASMPEPPVVPEPVKTNKADEIVTTASKIASNTSPSTIDVAPGSGAASSNAKVVKTAKNSSKTDPHSTLASTTMASSSPAPAVPSNPRDQVQQQQQQQPPRPPQLPQPSPPPQPPQRLPAQAQPPEPLPAKSKKRGSKPIATAAAAEPTLNHATKSPTRLPTRSPARHSPLTSSSPPSSIPPSAPSISLSNAQENNSPFVALNLDTVKSHPPVPIFPAFDGLVESSPQNDDDDDDDDLFEAISSARTFNFESPPYAPTPSLSLSGRGTLIESPELDVHGITSTSMPQVHSSPSRSISDSFALQGTPTPHNSSGGAMFAGIGGAHGFLGQMPHDASNVNVPPTAFLVGGLDALGLGPAAIPSSMAIPGSTGPSGYNSSPSFGPMGNAMYGGYDPTMSPGHLFGTCGPTGPLGRTIGCGMDRATPPVHPGVSLFDSSMAAGIGIGALSDASDLPMFTPINHLPPPAPGAPQADLNRFPGSVDRGTSPLGLLSSVATELSPSRGGHQPTEHVIPSEPIHLTWQDIRRLLNDFYESNGLGILPSDCSSKFFCGTFRGIPSVCKVFFEEAMTDHCGNSRAVGKRSSVGCFLREVRVLTECQHPNILPLLLYSLHPYALLFPIKSPGTLRQVLTMPETRQSLGMMSRLRVGECVLSALSYLHQGSFSGGTYGVIHGNIGMDSVVVEGLEGKAYLTDFGSSSNFLLPNGTHDQRTLQILQGIDMNCIGGDLYGVGEVILRLVIGMPCGDVVDECNRLLGVILHGSSASPQHTTSSFLGIAPGDSGPSSSSSGGSLSSLFGIGSQERISLVQSIAALMETNVWIAPMPTPYDYAGITAELLLQCVMPRANYTPIDCDHILSFVRTALR